MKKWSVAALVAALVLALLSACGSNANKEGGASSPAASQGSGEKPKMLLYEWNNNDAVVYGISEDIVNEYNARPDAKVVMEIQHIPGSDTYYPKLNAGLAANSGPDAFTLHAAGKMKTYADANRIMDLTEILNSDPEWKNSFTSGAFNLMTFDEKIYAVPTAFAAVPLYYNKEIFEQYNLTPPTTYDELKHIITVLRQNNVTPFAFGAKDSWTAALFSEIIANRIGGDKPFDDLMNGGGTWLDPSFIEMGKVMVELRDMGAFPEGFLGLDNSAINNMFKNGEAAMFVMGSWSIGGLYKDDSKVIGKIGITKFPTFPGGKGDIDTWLGQPSYNLSINASTQHKDVAIEYLKMWTSEKIQRRIAEEAGEIPAVNIELDTNKVPPLSQDLQKEMSTMKGMFIFYDVGLGAKIGDEYNATIQAILAGKDVEEAFKSLEQYTIDNRE